MVAVSGDPLRTNAYAFAHNGILGYPTTKRSVSRRSGRACSARRGARPPGLLAWTCSGSLAASRASAPRASGSTTRCGRARRRKGCSRARRSRAEFPRQRVELIRGVDPTAEVNRLYLLRGWTDGLPIVPPTLGRIDEMLEQSPLERHAPRSARWSRWAAWPPWRRVAANAVMAGCRPEYFPVVLAAVAGHPGSRLQPARRADHGRERRAAPDRQRPGARRARHQRGLGRARPGLAGQRRDRPRGAPGHEQPRRRVAGRGVLRRPRPAGALQPLPRASARTTRPGRPSTSSWATRPEQSTVTVLRAETVINVTGGLDELASVIGSAASLFGILHSGKAAVILSPFTARRLAKDGMEPGRRAPRALHARPAPRRDVATLVAPRHRARERLARVGARRRGERLDPGGVRARRPHADRGRRRPADSPARLLPVLGPSTMPGHARDRAGAGTLRRRRATAQDGPTSTRPRRVAAAQFSRLHPGLVGLALLAPRPR